MARPDLVDQLGVSPAQVKGWARLYCWSRDKMKTHRLDFPMMSDAWHVARLLRVGVITWAIVNLLLLTVSGGMGLVYPGSSLIGWVAGACALVVLGLIDAIRRRARLRATILTAALWVASVLTIGAPYEAARHWFSGVPPLSAFFGLALFVVFGIGAFFAHVARDGHLRGVIVGFAAPLALCGFFVTGVAAKRVLDTNEWRNRRIAFHIESVERDADKLRIRAILDLTGANAEDLKTVSEVSATYEFSRLRYDEYRHARLEWSNAPRPYERWTPGVYRVLMTVADVGNGPERPDGKSQLHVSLDRPATGGMEAVWETRIPISPSTFNAPGV